MIIAHGRFKLIWWLVSFTCLRRPRRHCRHAGGSRTPSDAVIGSNPGLLSGSGRGGARFGIAYLPGWRRIRRGRACRFSHWAPARCRPPSLRFQHPSPVGLVRAWREPEAGSQARLTRRAQPPHSPSLPLRTVQRCFDLHTVHASTKTSLASSIDASVRKRTRPGRRIAEYGPGRTLYFASACFTNSLSWWIARPTKTAPGGTESGVDSSRCRTAGSSLIAVRISASAAALSPRR